MDSLLREPLLVPQRGEKMATWVLLVDPLDGGQGKVVIVVVRYQYCVDEWQVFDFAGHLGVSLRTEPGERRAPVFEDGVEQDPHATGEFNVVACMTQPCGPHFGSGSAR